MKSLEMESLLKQIKFEQKWLHDVLDEDGRVTHADIDIAISGIKNVLGHMRIDKENK